MSDRDVEHLRVLLAHERTDRLVLVAATVAALGHEVIACTPDADAAAAVTAKERPDVALVGLGAIPDRALELIERIVEEAACPVIALIGSPNPRYVREAARRGVFAYITDRPDEDWQSAIDIGLRRFAEYRELEGAFGRRAITERAKGILMERHSVDEGTAFRMLREHARAINSKLVDVAAAIAVGHQLLPPKRAAHEADELSIRARRPRPAGRAAAAIPRR